MRNFSNDLSEVIDIANALTEQEECVMTQFEAFQIAVGIQRNGLYSQAHVLDFKNKPSALESIAMELGASRKGPTIKSALQDLLEKWKN